MLGLCAVFFHMFDPGIAEHLSGDGTLGKTCAIEDYEINRLNIVHQILFHLRIL